MKNNALTVISAQELFTQAQELMSSAPDEAITHLLNAEKKAKEEKNYGLACRILIYLSRNFRFKGKPYESVEQLNKAYRLLNQHIPNDQDTLAYIYKEFGSLYSDGFKDHTTALSYSLKSLRLNVAELKPPLFNNLGSHYIYLKKYEKAFSCLTKGKALCETQKDFFVLSFIYENFGSLFKIQEKYTEAIEYYQTGLKASEQLCGSEEHKQSVSYIQSYIQIGLAETYYSLRDFDKVSSCIQTIKKIASASNVYAALSEAHLLEGKLLLERNQIAEFENLFKTSIQFCTEMSFFEDQKKWLNMIIELYEKQKRYEEALTFSKKIISISADQDLRSKAISLATILENKELEILELENRNRQMQLQKEQLEQFAYIVAHDLKTPLSNISNFIGLFNNRHQGEISEDNQYYLDFALDNSKRLLKMLDDLLRYITVKKTEQGFPICDVSKLLTRIVKLNEEQIKKVNAKIEYKQLPEVRMESFHLEIILDNLIRNALKFSRADESPLILVSFSEDEKEYIFTVADNGIGIEEEYRQKIFDVFKQLDKVNYKGTGMGLSICKKIIRIYGGKIWVTGNERNGTSFKFNIPKPELDI